jgi:SAM-dependent methyltransferase
MADSPRRRLLEIGCGEGGFVRTALDAGHDAQGIDIAVPRFQKCAASDAEWVQRLHEGNANSIPFPDDQFDVVVSWSALEHYADVDAFLRESKRVLAPGGVMYVSSGHFWHAARGAHLYNYLTVPWVHLIYPYDVIVDWYRTHQPGTPLYPIEEIPADRRDLPYGGMNQLSLSDYRRAFASSGMQVVSEKWQRTGLTHFLRAFPELVRKYGLDELATDSCVVVLRKTA